MQQTREMLREHVEANADRIDELEADDIKMGVADEEEHDIVLDPLDVRVTCGLDGDLRNIVLVLTTGGPHIELDLSTGRVDGFWSGEEVSIVLDNDELIDLLWSQYETMYRA